MGEMRMLVFLTNKTSKRYGTCRWIETAIQQLEPKRERREKREGKEGRKVIK